MSGLTPEAARAAAEWLEKRDASVWLEGQRLGTGRWVRDLRAEADRLEAAAKTPGQVAFEMSAVVNPRPGWGEIASETQAYWERIAAAVIAHHVGPDRVMLSRDDLDAALNDPRAKPSVIDRLREALS